MVSRSIWGACLLLLSVGAVRAQESRGSITGRVSDPQGAVIPNAAVVITNVETNVVNRTLTNDAGYFEVNLINPGTYTVAVEAAGFKKAVRAGLALSVAGRLDVDMRLQIGQIAETVEVTAETPMLETAIASGGRVIDNRQIMQLPFSDMNPFALSALAPGMQWTGQPEYRRPFDNGGTSAFNTMGGVGSNEYTIDGAPATGTGRRVGFVPPSDAVEEFKLETTSFDASYGHTSGATINVMTKAGTNTYHGSAYDQHWQQRWNATQHFTRLAWEDQVRRGNLKPSDPKQAPGRSNQFGATLGGPMRIPRLYNGKDRFFFFFSYNGIYQTKTETTSSINRTVPKMAWRQGDFSDLLPIDAVKYTVYDPRSSRRQGNRVLRTPFPGNKGVPILNPMYNFYTSLYPKPNDVPGVVSPEGNNNYLATGMPKNERFNSLVNRFDYNISERHRVFGRWYWNHRLADEYDWTYETRRGLHSNGLTRINRGIGGDYIWTIDSHNNLDLGVNWNRFVEGSVQPVQIQFKPTDVGLPAYLDAKAGAYHTLPRISFSTNQDIGAGYPSLDTSGSTAELKAGMTTIRGNHSLKYGWNERRYWYASGGIGNSSGSFSFNNTYMKAADNTTTASNLGLEWAAFMMGLPSGISIDTNDTGYWSTRFRALYLQDDWRASNRLRLNLGLRYEREGGITERFNRAIASGFNFDARLPFSDAVEAAYARNPLAELPASQFRIQGGSEYLGANHKTYTDGTHHLLPRIGVVYQLSNKTVLRAGYGWYYDTYNVNNTRPSQYGFSLGTGTVITTDQGLNFCCGVGAAGNLSAANNLMIDPFPVRPYGVRFETPTGNRLGSVAFAGRGYGYTPREYSPAGQQRWRVGVQRELRSRMVVEVSYNASYARLPLSQTISFLPQKYWSTGNVRNKANEDDLNTNIPNPFNIQNLSGLRGSDPFLYNYLSTQGFFTADNIRKHQLLRAYPQMNGLSGLRPGVSFDEARGADVYHDLEVHFERRFSRGFQTAVIYTRAYSEVRDFYDNEFDTEPSWRPNNNVRPHRFVWSAIYELPFGKGKRWVQENPVRHIVGGWQLSWIYQYQSGPVVGWGNRFYYGDIGKINQVLRHDEIHSKDIHLWFDPNIVYKGSGAIPEGFAGFEGRSDFQPGPFHVRIFPNRLDMREDGIRDWDAKILRRFKVTERVNTSFAVDLLNATNHTNFEGPNTDPTSKNFGKVSTQRGLSRVIQFNLRVDF